MSQTITESYCINNEMNLYISQDLSLTIYADSLFFTKQNKILQECRLSFCVTPTTYQNIDTQALFNLKPEIRSPFSAGVFDSSTDIQIEASLDPDLLPKLAEYATDVNQTVAYLQKLNQEEPDNPLFSAYSWYALEVKQQRETGETSYRTLWFYLQPSLITVNGIANEQISQAMEKFAQEWTINQSSDRQEENINQALEQMTNAFSKATEDISEMTEQVISEAIEELNDVFDNLAQEISEITEEIDFNESIFATVVNFFTEERWKFTVVAEELTIYMNVQGNNGQWNCYAKVREAERQFIFYSICPINVPKFQLLKIAEFIARANYDVIIGNFELDFRDGEIRYKTSIDVEDNNFSFTSVKNLAYTNIAMMDKYLPGIMAVINDNIYPELAVKQVEQNTEIYEYLEENEQGSAVVPVDEQKELASKITSQLKVNTQETRLNRKPHILAILTPEEIAQFHQSLQVMPHYQRKQAEAIIEKVKKGIITRLGESGEEIFTEGYNFFTKVKIEIKNLKLIQRYSGIAERVNLLLLNLNSESEDYQKMLLEHRFINQESKQKSSLLEVDTKRENL